ncbi:MAG: hypothetical protein HC808_18020 [Candidatus Competibacteraceae bacterium]|nr:hypothetical protein [Candidatus Competibacteraceae bacterium]
MRQMNLDTEAVRLMLIMRRQILSEFGAWISLDDENAAMAIRDYGLQSKDESLRKMAIQIGPLIGESPTNEPEHMKPTGEKHYYRGTLMHEEHESSQHAQPEKSATQAQEDPLAESTKPVKNSFLSRSSDQKLKAFYSL